MDPVPATIEALLKNDMFCKQLASVDLVMGEILASLSPEQLVLHAFQQLYPAHIQLREVRATAHPVVGKPLVMARSTHMVVEGVPFHLSGVVDMEQVFAAAKLRVPGMLEKRSLPKETQVKFSTHPAKPNKEDLSTLCPELFALIKACLPAGLASVQADQLSGITPQVALSKPGARM